MQVNRIPASGEGATPDPERERYVLQRAVRNVSQSIAELPEGSPYLAALGSFRDALQGALGLCRREEE